MATRVLYVTSFASDMYKATGESLVKSFIDTGTPGTLLCFPEGFDIPEPPPRVLARSLTGDTILNTFLHQNKDVIPAHLGGEHQGCACPGGPYGPHSKLHQEKCVGHWFNRNASRWFRKVVSLYRALERPADIMVWLDSDCVFKRSLPEQKLAKVFQNKAVFYMKSRKRKVLESGIMGFFLARGGKAFIELTMNRYISGEFRKYRRWDDSFQFQTTRDEHKHLSTIDIATGMSGHSEVACHTPLAPYLEHFKGKHGRGLGIMT